MRRISLDKMHFPEIGTIWGLFFRAGQKIFAGMPRFELKIFTKE
jgi:hypothetical protein